MGYDVVKRVETDEQQHSPLSRAAHLDIRIRGGEGGAPLPADNVLAVSSRIKRRRQTERDIARKACG